MTTQKKMHTCLFYFKPTPDGSLETMKRVWARLDERLNLEINDYINAFQPTAWKVILDEFPWHKVVRCTTNVTWTLLCTRGDQILKKIMPYLESPNGLPESRYCWYTGPEVDVIGLANTSFYSKETLAWSVRGSLTLPRDKEQIKQMLAQLPVMVELQLTTGHNQPPCAMYEYISHPTVAYVISAHRGSVLTPSDIDRLAMMQLPQLRRLTVTARTADNEMTANAIRRLIKGYPNLVYLCFYPGIGRDGEHTTFVDYILHVQTIVALLTPKGKGLRLPIDYIRLVKEMLI